MNLDQNCSIYSPRSSYAVNFSNLCCRRLFNITFPYNFQLGFFDEINVVLPIKQSEENDELSR